MAPLHSDGGAFYAVKHSQRKYLTPPQVMAVALPQCRHVTMASLAPVPVDDLGAPLTGSWSYTSTGYIGSKSLAISRTSSSGTIRVDSTQAAYCPANSSYTLSAYVKTTGMSGGGLGAQLVLTSSGNVIASSAPITTNTDWTRVEVTYTNTTGSDISDLTAGMRNGTSGTAYFDCVQLEASANASRYNLVDNGDFSYNSSLGWNKNSACTSADGSSSNYYRAPALNDSCLKLVGAAEKDKQVSQNYFPTLQLQRK